MTRGNECPRDRDRALRHGELTVLGRIRSASNATFLCEATLDDVSVHCVYKPVAGERPLWDFPDGTLAGREYATYLVSQTLGWNIVPDTIIRDGPAGAGMLQIWVDQCGDEDRQPDGRHLDPVDLCPAGEVPAGYHAVLRAYDYAGDEVMLVHSDDPGVRRMAVFDLLVNNADRKGGHILAGIDGQVYGVDHGLCLHTEDKLRTVLWGWSGQPVGEDLLEAVVTLVTGLEGELAEQLCAHISPAEVVALGRRARELLADPVMPRPDGRRPIPWPAF